MIAITETDSGELEIELQVPLIPSKYSNLVPVFSKDTANTLPEHRDYNLSLETIGIPPFGPLYNLSRNKLMVLQEYIADTLAK